MPTFSRSPDKLQSGIALKVSTKQMLFKNNSQQLLFHTDHQRARVPKQRAHKDIRGLQVLGYIIPHLLQKEKSSVSLQ